MSMCRKTKATKTQLFKHRRCTNTIADDTFIHTPMFEAGVTTGIFTVSSVPQEEQVQGPTESMETVSTTTDHAAVEDDTFDPMEADSSITESQAPLACDGDTKSLGYSRFIFQPFRSTFPGRKRKTQDRRRKNKSSFCSQHFHKSSVNITKQSKTIKRVMKGGEREEKS